MNSKNFDNTSLIAAQFHSQHSTLQRVTNAAKTSCFVLSVLWTEFKTGQNSVKMFSRRISKLFCPVSNSVHSTDKTRQACLGFYGSVNLWPRETSAHALLSQHLPKPRGPALKHLHWTAAEHRTIPICRNISPEFQLTYRSDDTADYIPPSQTEFSQWGVRFSVRAASNGLSTELHWLAID